MNVIFKIKINVFPSIGTDATVSIELYGDKGNTGARVLDGKFERNDIDEFGVEAVDLGKIEKIRIGKNKYSDNDINRNIYDVVELCRTR